ncbi:hypothetical protein G7Y89_g1601 [Cudoniella acicularis]|uniref:Uncharacterized protein n=1 Tax=Cudoniella acicularis TaxID=354080 RepID=A0A8H4RW23_9HELO|nr:hypothetical protein G7Y89_g1601 [Cudoniella acicularis]
MFTDPAQDSRTEEAGPNLYLMTTASTPATPGPSSPTTVMALPIEQIKIDDDEDEIIPPIRPSSTPFPQADMVEGDIQCLQRLNDPDRMEGLNQIPLSSASSTKTLCALPTEIHDCILDHLTGVRASATSRTTTAGRTKVLRSWGTALRHARRREVAELARVSPKWRELVQDRLYRHLKIKGTTDSILQAYEWFCDHPHLQAYVKHIEIWFPVFQQKNMTFDRTLRIPTPNPDRPRGQGAAEFINGVTYKCPTSNSTLEDVFEFVQSTFREACILTLEGGDRKKPPMVKHFRNSQVKGQTLPTISRIRTLVCKGQWNIIRSNEDFQTIAAALPNLNEWHGIYAKPKSKSYISMAATLPHIPLNLTHLNICLENDYRREAVSPTFVRKIGQKEVHFCTELAKAIPTLEHVAFTGRICRCFFDDAAKLSNPRTSRLKSIDLIVKNVCRPAFVWNDGTGITDMQFIVAFEQLVLGAVKSLDKLAALEVLRIRFIDLGKCWKPIIRPRLTKTESQVPALNPYFQLQNNEVTGIWSDSIIETLSYTRPAAQYLEKADTFGEDVGFRDGQIQAPPTFKKRPLSIKVSNYHTLSGGITIT